MRKRYRLGWLLLPLALFGGRAGDARPADIGPDGSDPPLSGNCDRMLFEGTDLRPGSVLIVDDEAHVREILRLFLSRFGYQRIIERGDGRELEALVQDEGAKLAGVFMDVNLPGRNGQVLYAALRAIAPKLHIVMISGALPQQLNVDGILSIEKPFKMEAILQVMRRHVAP